MTVIIGLYTCIRLSPGHDDDPSLYIVGTVRRAYFVASFRSAAAAGCSREVLNAHSGATRVRVYMPGLAASIVVLAGELQQRASATGRGAILRTR